MANNNITLTQQHLQSRLSYNPLSGEFTWLTQKNGTLAGSIAGHKFTNHDGKKYISIKINSRAYLAHRLVFLYMTGLFPKDQTDHIDGDGLNNVFSNLRMVTQSENQKNRKLSVNNKTGCSGVRFRLNKYEASIRCDSKYNHLGVYFELWDAICARKSAEFKHGYHKNSGRIA